MPDTMALLQFEHRNLTSLLGVVHQQRRRMASGAPVNYEVLASAFAYLLDYPDQCHHPKEDAVYRRLLLRHSELQPKLHDLVEEHATLAGMTRDLAHAIDQSRRDAPTVDGKLADRLNEFVDFYSHHMTLEERYFFPAAQRYLSSDDWADIDFEVFDRPDPLYDPDTEARFSALRQVIRHLGAADEAANARRDETAMLAGTRDVAEFNALMERSGETLQLRHSLQEGYEVVRGGIVLAYIPECTEFRAAWCAYFFWKGMARKSRS